MPALNSTNVGLSAGAFGISLVGVFLPGPSMPIVAMVLTAVIFVLSLMIAKKLKQAGMTRHEPKTQA